MDLLLVGVACVLSILFWNIKIDKFFLLTVISMITISYLSIYSFAYILTLLFISNLVDTSAKSEKKVNYLSYTYLLGLVVFLFIMIRLNDGKILNITNRQLISFIGVSYFTFKLIHYIVEKSAGRLKNIKRARLWSYLLFFPSFTSGPIHLLEKWPEKLEKPNKTEIQYAFGRILLGLYKKIVLLNLILNWVNITYFDFLQTQLFLKAIIRYMEVYIDFSAYCDIALGLGILFGIKLPENFQFPFLASNILDFWSKWHITLSSWCKRYIYLPTLCYVRNPILGTFLVFLVIGLWHEIGVIYLVWGMYHFLGVIGYSYLRKIFNFKLPVILGVIITQLFVITGSLIFVLA